MAVQAKLYATLDHHVQLRWSAFQSRLSRPQKVATFKMAIEPSEEDPVGGGWRA